MAIDKDLFSSSNFQSTIMRYCNQIGWQIYEINASKAILQFNMTSGTTQTLFILRYDTTLEFSCPSGLKFDTFDYIPHGLSSYLLVENSKFKELMITVESIVDNKPVPESVPQSSSDREEKEPIMDIPTTEASSKPAEKPQAQLQLSFDGDDDVPQPQTDTAAKYEQKTETGSPTELVNMGMSFLSRLSETLANPEATQQLISTIVQKDETDGKTYLKIPIENQVIQYVI